METRMFKVYAKADPAVALKVIPGHFATNHSHINYYIDLTTLKARQNEAQAASEFFAFHSPSKPRDERYAQKAPGVLAYVWMAVK